MGVVWILIIYVSVTLIEVCFSMPVSTTEDSPMTMANVTAYLEQYQYMGQGSPSEEMRKMSRENETMATNAALVMFQQLWGLNVTGMADEATIELMMKDRCGMPDMMSGMDMMRRKKRYNAQARWPKTDLTYKIQNDGYTMKLGRTEVDSEIRRALDVWSAVTPLTFTESQTQQADIIIFFASGNHGDGNAGAFDGPNGVLAHAYFPTNDPIGGDSHFDEDELWTINTNNGINLFQVAAHEFGHALGLGHSDIQAALMAPFYQGYVPNYQLHEDDVAGIQYLYGLRTTTSSNGVTASTTTPSASTEPPTMGPAADLCRQPKFDAITTVVNRNGESNLFGFKGNQYFKLDNGIFYPEVIQDSWPGLPVDIDAALHWEAKSSRQWSYNYAQRRWEIITVQEEPPYTFVFKGDQFWQVKDMTVTADSPRPISEWGFPADIDSIFEWGPNDKTYAFKDGQYYRYTRGYGLDAGYPRSISVWSNELPNTIDAVIHVENVGTYFFSENMFYIVDDYNLQISGQGTIQETWFKCDRFSDYVNGNVSMGCTLVMNVYMLIFCLVMLRLWN